MENRKFLKKKSLLTNNKKGSGQILVCLEGRDERGEKGCQVLNQSFQNKTGRMELPCTKRWKPLGGRDSEGGIPGIQKHLLNNSF